MRAAGFTLLEILVAIAIFALMTAGLAQSVRYGLDTQRSQFRQSGRVSDLDAVDRSLRHMITMMDPGDEADPAAMAATGGRLTFNTMLPDEAATQGSQRVSVELTVDAARRLVLRWRPLIHAQRLRSPPAPMVTELLAGVARMDLAFWKPGGGWVTTWRYADLPALVRIRLVFPPGDPRHWPDLVAAPRLARR